VQHLHSLSIIITKEAKVAHRPKRAGGRKGGGE
jgi:hypothetical protein